MMSRSVRNVLSLAAICAASAGCSAKDTETTSGAAPPAPVGVTKCDASMLGDIVGKPASEELGNDAVKRSGSRTMRWLAPGMAVTMDFREDRLNIELDADRKVVGSRCG